MTDFVKYYVVRVTDDVIVFGQIFVGIYANKALTRGFG